MKVNRENLLSALRFAKLGTPTKGETLEQSNAFVFTESKLITFDDEIMTVQTSPLDAEISVAILADEFLKLVEKFPDEELEINVKGDEVILKGSKREAGVTCFNEIHLPYDAVPQPGKMSVLGEGFDKAIQQAARTCGKDITQELTTMVHITSDLIEACDNWRLFRVTMSTGFKEECLLPSTSVMKLSGLGIKKVALKEGWAHFQTESKQIISVRCSYEKYHEGIERLLDIGKSEQVKLPPTLGEIISRTVVMMNVQEEPKIQIHLTEGELVVESRKDSGWYKEKKRVKYTGGNLSFEVNPKFLSEILQRTNVVHIGNSHRMKIEVDNIQFVVALVKPD